MECELHIFYKMLTEAEMPLENLFWNRLIVIYNHSKLKEYWADKCKYTEKIPSTGACL